MGGVQSFLSTNILGIVYFGTFQMVYFLLQKGEENGILISHLPELPANWSKRTAYHS